MSEPQNETEPILELLSTTKNFLEDDGETIHRLKCMLKSIDCMTGYLRASFMSSWSSLDGLRHTVEKYTITFEQVRLSTAVNLFGYGLQQLIIAYPVIVNPYERILINDVEKELARMAIYYALPCGNEARYGTQIKFPLAIRDVRIMLFFTFVDDQMRRRVQPE